MCSFNDVQAAALGLTALQGSADLSSVAQAHSDEEAAQNYFSHFSSNGSSPYDRVRSVTPGADFVSELSAAGWPSVRSVLVQLLWCAPRSVAARAACPAQPAGVTACCGVPQLRQAQEHHHELRIRPRRLGRTLWCSRLGAAAVADLLHSRFRMLGGRRVPMHLAARAPQRSSRCMAAPHVDLHALPCSNASVPMQMTASATCACRQHRQLLPHCRRRQQGAEVLRPQHQRLPARQ